MRHVRPGSVTAQGGWHPPGAVAFTIGGHRYLACHTTPGGSAFARIVHFHIADDPRGGFTWCHFPASDDAVRRRCPATIG